MTQFFPDIERLDIGDQSAAFAKILTEYELVIPAVRIDSVAVFVVQAITVLQNVVFLQQTTYIVIQDASDVPIRPTTGDQCPIPVQWIDWHWHPNDAVRHKLSKELLFGPAFALEGLDLRYFERMKIEVTP